MAYAPADRAHPGRHRRRADLLAHAGDDGAGGRDDRTTPRAGACMLGIGVSHRPVVEGWHGQTDRQARDRDARVRRDRARDPARRAAARRARSGRTQFRLSGIGPFPDLPIGDRGAVAEHAAPRRRGRRRASILWLCNPNYIRDVVVPVRARGPRDRPARRSTGSTSSPPSRPPRPTTSTRAYDAMRRDLLPYFGLPVLPRDARALGLRRRHRRATTRPPATRRRWAPRSPTTSSASLTAVGDEDRARRASQRYLDAGATSPCVGPIPKTDFEATLRAGAPEA